MGTISDATGVWVHGLQDMIQDLHANPDKEQDPRRKVGDGNKPSEDDECFDPGIGEQDKVSAKNAGDGPRCPQGGHRGGRIEYYMGCSRSQSYQQVKSDEAPMPHAVLNIVSKNPKINHVAQ